MLKLKKRSSSTSFKFVQRLFGWKYCFLFETFMCYKNWEAARRGRLRVWLKGTGIIDAHAYLLWKSASPRSCHLAIWLGLRGVADSVGQKRMIISNAQLTNSQRQIFRGRGSDNFTPTKNQKPAMYETVVQGSMHTPHSGRNTCDFETGMQTFPHRQVAV